MREVESLGFMGGTAPGERPWWAHLTQGRVGGGWGGTERCVCVCVCEGLRGPSPGQRCLAAWALQGAPETGNLYMEPPLVQTLHSQLHAVYCKSSHCSSIAIHTLRHAQTIIVTFMNLHVHFFFFFTSDFTPANKTKQASHECMLRGFVKVLL